MYLCNITQSVVYVYVLYLLTIIAAELFGAFLNLMHYSSGTENKHCAIKDTQFTAE